jgi:hypothetical protein
VAKEPDPLDVPPCRTDDMRMAHGLFRSLFADAPRLVRGVAAGDRDRAAIVADHVLEVTAGLHRHHSGEDLLLWDALAERSPGCALHVGLMRTQHQEVSDLLDEVDESARAWRRTGSGVARAELAERLDAVAAALLRHLGEEEEVILPAAAAVFSQREWNRLGEHGRAGIPRNRLFIQLGFILSSMEPDAARAFLAEMPPQVRVLFRMLGRRQYLAHRRRVYGTAA